jgi:hypothetical protein
MDTAGLDLLHGLDNRLVSHVRRGCHGPHAARQPTLGDRVGIVEEPIRQPVGRDGIARPNLHEQPSDFAGLVHGTSANADISRPDHAVSTGVRVACGAAN